MRIVHQIAQLICCLGCISAAAEAQCREWQPPAEFLRAVRFVESSDGANTYGDDGESLGEFQISEAAWLDVNMWRRGRGLKTYPYEGTVYHTFISRVYASNFFTILHGELKRKLGRAPSPAELYAAYNLGLRTFAQCEYKLERVNPVTRAKCELIQGRLGGPDRKPDGEERPGR